MRKLSANFRGTGFWFRPTNCMAVDFCMSYEARWGDGDKPTGTSVFYKFAKNTAWEIYEQHVLHVIYVLGVCGNMQDLQDWVNCVKRICRRNDTLRNIYQKIRILLETGDVSTWTSMPVIYKVIDWATQGNVYVEKGVTELNWGSGFGIWWWYRHLRPCAWKLSKGSVDWLMISITPWRQIVINCD